MANKKIKILFFIPGFNYGGIESFALTVMERIDSSRFQIDLLKHNNNPDDTPLVKHVKELGGEVYNVPAFRFTELWTYIQATFRFFRNHSDYKVIHCHSLIHSFFLLFFGKKAGIPIRILHAHTTHWDDGILRHVLGTFFRNISLPLATHYFACSDLAALWGFGKRKCKRNNVRIIHNGIDLQNFIFNENDRLQVRTELGIESNKVIGHIGRLTTAKNGLFLLEIVKKAITEDPDIVLVQIGDGPDLDRMKQYAYELQISNHIKFLGRKEQVSRYYSAFDLFLLPSLWEGAPVTVIEAQANGLPCILSNVITRDVNICKNIHYVSLQEPTNTWNKILATCWNKRENSHKNINLLTEMGFDNHCIVTELENIYSK